MECERFPEDTYALHALGLLEGEERGQLAAQLRDDCQTCRAALRDAFEFWFLFGALSERLFAGSIPQPSPGFRRRVLNSIRPVPLHRAIMPIWSWARVAAGGILALGASVSTWQVSQVLSRREVRRLQSEVSSQTKAVQQLESQNRDLRRTLQEAPRPSVVPPPPVVDPSAAAARSALEAQVVEAREAAAISARALADERARAGALEKDIADRTSQLAAVTRERDETERKYRAALDQAAQDVQRGNTARAEAASLRTRIQTLETEIALYRRTIETQRQQLAEHLRLASILRSPSVLMVRMRGTEAGRSASGVALIADNTVVFYGTNLPALSPGRAYQLWLIRDRGPAIVSAGVFDNWRQDSPAVRFANPALTTRITGLAVTEEPAAGSPLPTGHKLLIGTPRG